MSSNLDKDDKHTCDQVNKETGKYIDVLLTSKQESIMRIKAQ